jgi:Ala-tRNA(Pro) deacylase
MPIPKEVRKYLDKRGVKYEVVPHRKVFTAYDLAQTLGEKLDKVAKTLLLTVELPELKTRGRYYIVAVPASYKVELDRVKKSLKATKVGIAPEEVMRKLGIVPGTLSPFAALHELELLLDKALLRSKDVLVRAGSLTESIRIRSRDLHKMERAMAGVFGKRSGAKLQAKVKKSKKKPKATKKPAKKKAKAKKRR